MDGRPLNFSNKNNDFITPDFCVPCILQVNAYGFGGSYVKFSEHYYDKTYNRHVNYANHDNGAENALWQRLHDLGVINLYHRD